MNALAAKETAFVSADAPVMSGGQLLLKTLEHLGIDVVFGYPGGAIMPVYDALPGSALRHILVRHEQSAAFAADAWARVTGKPGVCIATSGPGATNLVTGIANAMLDLVPLIAITGQVPTSLMGTDAFQEVDVLGITLPIVKHSMIVRSTADIPAAVQEAYRIAITGRPGPVLIDLPKDVVSATISRANPIAAPHAWPDSSNLETLEAAKTLIEQSARPVLYVGGGVSMAGAVEPLREFARATGIPVVATLKGLGVLPTDDPQFVGMLGMHGTQAANNAVQDCDLLICVGARFDDRATGSLAAFAPHARVIHFDVDPAEIGKLRRADVAVTGDLTGNLNLLRPGKLAIGAWIRRVQEAKADCAPRYDRPGNEVYAPRLLRALSVAAGEAFVAACDVGQHQMWVAQHCRFSDPKAHLTSGGLGAMGYGLPAGMAAKLARPDAAVVTITGDGSIMMNIQELATLRRYGIALKILLFDNHSLGLVRQWQGLFYGRNYSEIDLSDNPDFVAVADAFGIEAFRIERARDEAAGIARLLSAKGPCLAHVIIDPRDSVWPLVPPGQGNHEMIEGYEQ